MNKGNYGLPKNRTYKAPISASYAPDSRPYKVYTATITQDSGENIQTLTSQTDPFIIGQSYRIVTYNPGDNFTNVGAPINGSDVYFIATGTTAARWTNESLITANYGAPRVTNVFENTIGNVWWMYESTGRYTFVSNHLFTTDKTYITYTNTNTLNAVGNLIVPVMSYSDEARIRLQIAYNGDFVDEVVQNMPIEIRVYN